jgi:hypothetical protein
MHAKGFSEPVTLSPQKVTAKPPSMGTFSARAMRPAIAATRLPVWVKLFAVAAALRLLAFLVLYVGSILTGHHGSIDPFDSVGYDTWAWFAAEHIRAGEWVNLTYSSLEGSWDVGFTYLVAFEYVVVGHHPEVGRVVNCFLAAFSAPAVYLAARQTTLGEVVARRAGWLVAVWPLSIYWAGYDLLKDPLVWFFLSIALLAMAAAGWRSRGALGAFAAGGVHVVRNFMGPLVAVLLLFVALVKRDWRGLLATLGALAIVQVALLAVGYPPAWSLSPYVSSSRPSTGVSVCSASGQAPTGGSIQGAVGGTECAAPLTFSPKALALRIVVGVPTILLGPRLALKDIVHPNLDSGMYPGVLIWIALIPFTLLGLWRAVLKRDATLWGFALLGLAIWGSLALIYAGQAFRQREMAFPATLIFTSLGLERPWPRRWWWAYGIFWFLGLVILAAREIGLI